MTKVVDIADYRRAKLDAKPCAPQPVSIYGMREPVRAIWPEKCAWVHPDLKPKHD